MFVTYKKSDSNLNTQLCFNTAPLKGNVASPAFFAGWLEGRKTVQKPFQLALSSLCGLDTKLEGKRYVHVFHSNA